ncbi:MAG: septum formation initiator family protein [bacterium]
MRSLSRTRWLKLAVAAAVVFFLLANRGFRNLLRNWSELRNIRNQKAVADKERNEFRNKLERAEADHEYIEKLARIELGFMKPGEIEYRFPPPREEKK